ncbi:hypothetical protein [Chryseobacterium sp. c4a]|uniref:hypothetical protein n=1 Tax=Chryseobacterium sp. c4a TaxID=1573582 RepID=UPI00135A3F45|nr:hypothetical protein [Chryseobacterium sp. c4a]
MGIGFVIFIHLIAIFIASFICALIGVVVTYFVSKGGNKKRKILLAFITPFAGLYTLYICGIIGMSIVSDNKKVDIGMGDAWYVPLENGRHLSFIDIPEYASIVKEDGMVLVSEISKMEENGNLVLGKTFDNRYFSYNAKTDEVKDFGTEEELSASNGSKKLNLIDTIEFYSERKDTIMGYWPLLIGFLSFIISIGVVYIWKMILLF